MYSIIRRARQDPARVLGQVELAHLDRELSQYWPGQRENIGLIRLSQAVKPVQNPPELDDGIARSEAQVPHIGNYPQVCPRCISHTIPYKT